MFVDRFTVIEGEEGLINTGLLSRGKDANDVINISEHFDTILNKIIYTVWYKR